MTTHSYPLFVQSLSQISDEILSFSLSCNALVLHSRYGDLHFFHVLTCDLLYDHFVTLYFVFNLNIFLASLNFKRQAFFNQILHTCTYTSVFFKMFQVG